MNVVLLALILNLTSGAKISKCTWSEDGVWKEIPISRARGLLAALPIVAFGETNVKIWSEKSPIRVLTSHKPKSNKRTLEKNGIFQAVLSTLLESSQTNHTFSVNPAYDYYFTAQRTRPDLLGSFLNGNEEKLCYEASFRFLSPTRLLYVVIGIWLFRQARKLSNMLGFHYISGVGLGVCLSSLLCVLLCARMVPKKGGFMAILVGGSTVMAWLASKFWDQALDIIKTYPWVVLVYLGVTGAASFLTCYWFEDRLQNPRYQRVITWLLQLVGLILVFMSSWNIYLNIIIGLALLAFEFSNFSRKYPNVVRPDETPRIDLAQEVQRPNFFSPIKFLRQKSPFSKSRKIPPKRFLTQEEYEEQGKKETKSEVDCLREMIKNSPDPWKVLKTLRPETRAKLIDFVDNGDHLSEDTWDAAEDDSDSDLYAQDDRHQTTFGASPAFRNSGHKNLPRPGFQNKNFGNRSTPKWKY